MGEKTIIFEMTKSVHTVFDQVIAVTMEVKPWILQIKTSRFDLSCTQYQFAKDKGNKSDDMETPGVLV